MEALRTSLGRYLNAQASHASHPSPAELLAYRLGEVDQEAQDCIRDHLVRCDLCRLEYLDFTQWSQPLDHLESSDLAPTKDLVWRRVRCSIAGNVRSFALKPETRRSGYQAAWLLAASLTVSVGLSFWLSRPALEQPVADARIIQLLPTSLGSIRGTDLEQVDQVSSDHAMVLVAAPPIDKMSRDSAHAVLYKDSGQEIWRGEVIANEAGYMLIFPARRLPPDLYRLTLSWEGDSEGTEYRFGTADSTEAFR